MSIKKIMFILAISAAWATTTYANSVELSVNKPMNVTYRLAYQNSGDKTVFGEIQTARIENSTTISVQLNNYAFAGFVPISIDGHVIPESVTHFNQPNQCSVATNNKITSGKLSFIVSAKQLKCKSEGGMFD